MSSIGEKLIERIQLKLEEIKLLETYKIIEMNKLEQLIIREQLKIKLTNETAQQRPRDVRNFYKPPYFTLDIQELKYIEPIFNILKQFEERFKQFEERLTILENNITITSI